MNKFTAALVQFHWRKTPEENFRHVLSAIDEIGRRGDVRLIGLPEFFLGPPFYFPDRAYLKGIVDDTIPGWVTEELSKKARQYNTYILCGTIVERDGDDYYNSSALIDDQGSVIGKARKMHCYAAELVSIKSGEEIFIADTPLGKIGVCVCSDFWIQEVPRMLALNGAEIIYVSGASLIQDIDITRPCILANSVHNVCYTLYTSVVGGVTGQRAGQPSFSIEFGGYTTISSPREIVATLGDEEAILYATLDVDWVRELRQVDIKFKNTLYWGLWGRRPELYGDILKPYVEAGEDLKELLEAYLK